MKDELVAAAAKSAPPVAVAGSQVIFDMTLNQWVSIATIAYIVLQAVVLIRKEFLKKAGRT